MTRPVAAESLRTWWKLSVIAELVVALFSLEFKPGNFSSRGTGLRTQQWPADSGRGLGSDRFAGEFSRTGEECDDRIRGQMLDESLGLLKAAWSGEVVHHQGEHYTVDGIQFLPTPVRRKVPVWVAGFPGNSRPRQRAARLDGFFPVNLTSPDQFAEAGAQINALRNNFDPYDYVAEIEPGQDSTPYERAGAIWLLTSFDPATITVGQVRGVLRDGPVRGSR